MSVWSDVFLGVIAVATLSTAIVQIGVLIAAGRLAKRLTRLADHVEQELKPVLGHLDAIGRDASRAASLAVVQVERADRLFVDLARRIDDTLTIVQSAVAAPVREGTAVLAGIRGVLSALRDMRAGRARSRAEDEDALFI